MGNDVRIDPGRSAGGDSVRGGGSATQNPDAYRRACPQPDPDPANSNTISDSDTDGDSGAGTDTDTDSHADSSADSTPTGADQIAAVRLLSVDDYGKHTTTRPQLRRDRGDEPL
jgi:hypothetical protein